MQPTQNRLLWLTVVKTAIQDTAEGDPSLRTRAVHWLLHDNVDFPEICHMAGINADYLRKRILPKLAAPNSATPLPSAREIFSENDKLVLSRVLGLAL